MAGFPFDVLQAQSRLKGLWKGKFRVIFTTKVLITLFLAFHSEQPSHLNHW
jgi:hypothetical protein